jgi:hypothetical protein
MPTTGISRRYLAKIADPRAARYLLPNLRRDLPTGEDSDACCQRPTNRLFHIGGLPQLDVGLAHHAAHLSISEATKARNSSGVFWRDFDVGLLEPLDDVGLLEHGVEAGVERMVISGAARRREHPVPFIGL